LGNVIAIAAGGNHSLALRSDGTVVAWGENTDGQGSYVGQSTVPTDLNNVVAIAAGEYHSLAVKADGTVAGWGDDSQNQLSPLSSLTDAVGVSGGGAHSLVLKTDGTVFACGGNQSGQCNIPATVSNVLAIAAGDSHSVLLLGAQPAHPQPILPAKAGNQFSVVVQTVAGKNYTLEYKNSLGALNWAALGSVRGNGSTEFLIDSTANIPTRLYRVRQW
jgi:alpha-tubulin suppressor-like RCC1 family protein